MPARNFRSPWKSPFSMAPLRAKIEDTFQKLNDKLKPSKRRISEESEATQQSKQPRTLPVQYSSTFWAAESAEFGKLSPSVSGFQNPPPLPLISKASGAYDAKSSPTPFKPTAMSDFNWDGVDHQSGTSSKPEASPGSSFDNPIDLTATAPSSPPSKNSSDLSAGRAFTDPMDLSRGSSSHQSRRLQLLEDERIAKALQDEWNRDDASRSSFENPLDNGFFGAPEELDLSLDLPAFREHLMGLRCAKCKSSLQVNLGKVVNRTKEMVKAGGYLHPYLLCATCKIWSCAGIGCSEYHKSCSFRETHATFPRQDVKIAWCCDGGRLFLAFSLACGPSIPLKSNMDSPTVGLGDRIRTRFRSKSDNSSSSSQAGKQPDNTVPGTTTATEKLPKASKARHKPSQLSRGTGYGGPESYPFNGPKLPALPLPGQSKQKASMTADDLELESYFAALAIVLPCSSRSNATAFDYTQQPIITTMLSRSPLLPKASEILRQNSLTEMSCNSHLYLAVLDLLEAMGDHGSIAPIIYLEQVLYPPNQQLASFVFSGQAASHSASLYISNPPPKEETARPLDALLQRLAAHCLYFRKTASGHADEFKAEEQILFVLVNRIIAVAEKQDKDRAMVMSTTPHPRAISAPPPIPSANTRSRAKNEAENAAKDKIREEAEAWHRENCVSELPDEKIFESFCFTNRAREMGNLKPARGRMKKLVTQIASLRVDLPDGIYVRHGSSRIDIMKVLIVGPSDTPYEYGLFEFDVFCNGDFPQKAPEMQFRTTSGGKVAFNPNLYANGKVCLSLLGTWGGQAWEPERSTILQILVSIQAMIFNSQPWYNEPGRETIIDEMQSASYNKGIWGNTVKHAMLYWLNDRLAPVGKGKSSVVPVTPPPALQSAIPPGSSLMPGVQALPTPQNPSFYFPNQQLHLGYGGPLPTSFGSEALQQHLIDIVKPPGFDISPNPLLGHTPGALTSSSQTSHSFLPPHTPPFWAASLSMMQSAFGGQLKPSNTIPIGNTAVDSMDDHIWGPVIRKHFALKADLVLGAARRRCVLGSNDKLVKELEEALKRHHFK
ncbi:hypothetical protein B0T25DRAFT_101902 [Lasiosphaeria hispida]|uniref:UBC core domain-containing protein n=1 Tax=Lasiosphaeria hispida TaxID=260671 RepID=A0AAJ0HQD8_9PEZI|nr:hypothetical protein B0T25DRAFT_101902 [Lasiosphaeria hispida]